MSKLLRTVLVTMLMSVVKFSGQYIFLTVGLSHSKKLSSLLHWKTFTYDEECFLFHLKSSFRSQGWKFLSWLFGHVEKTAWLERQGSFQNSGRHNLQSFTSFFETLWCFNNFFFHGKWNDAQLLLIKWYIRVSSRVAKRLKT